MTVEQPERGGEPEPGGSDLWVKRFIVLVASGGFASFYAEDFGWPAVIVIAAVVQVVCEVIIRLTR